MRLSACLLCLSMFSGCGDDSPAAGGGSGAASSNGGAGGAASSVVGGSGGEPAICGTAQGELPEGLTTLEWNDGVAASSLREQNFEITADGKTFNLNEEPLHEAVRFDLEHPARVYGFSIHWAALPEDAAAELTAGLFPDFGHNGFDFWAPDPLYSGARCAVDIDADGWVSYVFEEPIEISDPGLVYVAHLAEPASPVFSFDDSEAGDGTCAVFAECHSALNLPEALTSTYFNGLSFPFQYDYLVRLHVEYTEVLEPEARLFQPVDFVSTPHASFGDYDADGDDDHRWSQALAKSG